MQEKIFISKTSSERIQTLLKNFIDKTKVKGVFIITKSGQLIDEYGYLKDLNLLSLAAILSGIASSIEKIGNLLKEDIKEILIEGKSYNVFFRIFKNNFIFSCVFKGIKIGMVKFESFMATEEISEILDMTNEKFKKDEVSNIIDRIIDRI